MKLKILQTSLTSLTSLTCLIACLTCLNAHAGYSIIVVPQQPEFITVNGPYGPETWDAPLVEPLLPPTVGRLVCQPDNYNQAAAEPARRTRVYDDSAGTATSQELFAACPQIRASKEREIRAEGAKRLSAMAAPYTAAERETWATQQREARAWLLDPAAPVPMISAMAAVRGLTLAVMVEKIMENVALFEAASGYILGLQQRLLDRIEAETDFAALLAIRWD